MWPMIGGLISGGASLLGNMFSANTSAQNTQAQLAAQQGMLNQTEQFNASQADINRQFQSNEIQQQEGFQEQMSGSAYRRAVMDMKMAGLNPMMMFGGGGAASTPMGGAASGSTASVGTPGVPMPQTQSGLAGLGDVVGKAVNSAIAVKSFDKMSDEVANLQAENARIKAATIASTEGAEQSRASANKMTTERRLEELAIPGKTVESQTAKDVLRSFGSDAEPGALPAWIRETLNSAAFAAKQLGGVASSASAVSKLIPELGY